MPDQKKLVEMAQCLQNTQKALFENNPPDSLFCILLNTSDGNLRVRIETLGDLKLLEAIAILDIIKTDLVVKLNAFGENTQPNNIPWSQ